MAKKQFGEGQKLSVVTVSPGDFDRKYRCLAGFGGGWQRELSRDHAFKLLKDWDAVQKIGVLILMERKEGGYYIIDGQHRVYAASEILVEPTQFMAVIRTVDSLPFSTMEQVAGHNGGKPFSLSAHLHNEKGISLWPTIFKKYGLEPSFSTGTTKIGWNQVIRGYLCGSDALDSKRWRMISPEATLIRQVWRETEEDPIDDMASICQWWNAGASYARKERGINSLHTSLAYGFAYMLWWSNKGKARDEAPMRLAKWTKLPSVVSHTSWGDYRMFFTLLLEGANSNLKAANRLKIDASY